jgi:hypothetical protein
MSLALSSSTPIFITVRKKRCVTEVIHWENIEFPPDSVLSRNEADGITALISPTFVSVPGNGFYIALEPNTLTSSQPPCFLQPG